MKELTCLYRIALLKEQPAASVEEVLQGIVGVLPEAWLYPAVAWVRLEVDGSTYTAGATPPEGPSLQAEIKVAGARQGLLEVGYSGDKPALDTGPFLQEEQKLLETVAREIALVLERREVAEQSRKLQEQLRHAERLATVGELAAGIVHELNDPLNNILGFAQLIEDSPELTEQTRRDVSMIVTSALHTREVIRQLLLFSRRTLQTGTSSDLSHLVQESSTFLQAICAKADIELVHYLATDLPPIWANPDQLRQVLVNLVLNASQAMPQGGRVTISTDEPDGEEGIVRLTVEDTGVGMS
ncbi:sensor histidine kinase, partial [Gemmatimonadota bacterium]